MMVHPKPSLAVILCGGVLWLQLVSASKMNVFKGQVIPDDYLTSSMAANSSCMCHKQCLVQPTCNGATYTYNSSDSEAGTSSVDFVGTLTGKSLCCFFSTHMLNETDLQPCPLPELCDKTVSFLRQPQRTTKDPDDGVTDESSTTTTTATTTATPTTTEATTTATPTTTEEPPACNGSIVVKGKYSVYLSNNNVSWSDAVTACNALDLELASLPSEEHFTAVREYLLQNCKSTNGLWVHLEPKNDEWKWGSGEKLAKKSNFWHSNQSGISGDNSRARMDNKNDFRLNNAKDDTQYSYICIPKDSETNSP